LKTLRQPGGSVLTAIDALKEAGAIVVGIAVIVDRGAKEMVLQSGIPYLAAFSSKDLNL